MKSCSLSEIVSIQVPQSTNYYSATPNSLIVNEIYECLDKNNLKIRNEIFKMNGKRDSFMGLHVIEGVGDNEVNMMVAWRNSYDRKKSFKLVTGFNVIVCENGMILSREGGITYRRVHKGTINTDAPHVIDFYISTYNEMMEKGLSDKRRMKEVIISESKRNEIIGRMYLDCDFINATQMGILKDEIKSPSFNYNAEGSIWELYQHTTHALKTSHPSDWIDNHKEAHEFFMSYV